MIRKVVFQFLLFAYEFCCLVFFEHWLQGQILLLLASMIHILMVQQTQPGPLLTPIIGVNSGPG